MAGVTVETADSAPAALERNRRPRLRRDRHDIKMPGMDGLALLAEIRARQPDTPILIITGHGEYALGSGLARGAYETSSRNRSTGITSWRRCTAQFERTRRIARGRDRQLALERCTSELEVIVEMLGRELVRRHREARQ